MPRLLTFAGPALVLAACDAAFTIIFPAEPSGDRVAEIVLGGCPYCADVETGEVAGLSD